jgi:aminopyrrolnitrin oxygenase
MHGGMPRQVELPAGLRSWYLLARSEELRRGQVLTRRLPGEEIVLFRGEGGEARALSAHCSHMGAHLGKGTVVGERLRCPLHHREYDGQGVCRRIPVTDAIPERACQATYPAVERYGGLFVFNGREVSAPAPSFAPSFGAGDERLRTIHGRSVRLACPWYAVAANAFDIQHLEAVHGRALRETPELEELPGGRMRLRYVSRVTGTGLTDRTMRRLSGDRIRVAITCWGGSILTVESDLGRARSALLLSLCPDGEATVVTPIFAVRRVGVPAVDAARAAAARWLYSGFLYRDVAILDGMRFRLALTLPEDAVLARFLAYLTRLPSADGIWDTEGHRWDRRDTDERRERDA